MQEYGLTKDGATLAEFIKAAERPADLPLKGWRWLAITREEGAAGVSLDLEAGTAVITTPAPAVTAAQVKAEAERRIDAGTTIGGEPFRTDEATMVRLGGVVTELTDDPDLAPVTYAKDSGGTVTFNNAAEARAVQKAANLYRSAVLEASATLQAADPIPPDYTNDSYWP